VVLEAVPYCDDEAVFAAVRDVPGAVFLDSALSDGKLGRWSFVAASPFLTWTASGQIVQIQREGATERIEGDVFEVLRRLLWECQSTRTSALPVEAGAFGYFGYGLRRFIERVPENGVSDLSLPDGWLAFHDAVVCFDHARKEAYLCSTGLPERSHRLAAVLANERAEALRRRIARSEEMGWPEARAHRAAEADTRIVSNFEHQDYLEVVRRAKEYIAAGDIFQANLSQRLACRMDDEPFALYRRLRRASPAPFAAYMEVPGGAVLSASPERFLQVRGRWIETRPIKGTRPRGSDRPSDEALANELLASAKDRAENVMIVDLERNDLGRVCKYGSVRVASLCALEAYAQVFHLVSTVEGELRDECGPVDVLRATFPGGSITGAPKVRAMEIIDELEPTARSVYTGAIGYIGFDGDLDLNIAIRTILTCKGWAYAQVGGGIVADSDPEAEYEETWDKAAGMMQALGIRGTVRAGER